MTNEKIWKSLTNFLSALGGKDLISMLHNTPSYMPLVEEFLSRQEAEINSPDLVFNLGVFVGEYINQIRSGFWKQKEDEPVVIVGPDNYGLVYETSPSGIKMENGFEQDMCEINPFSLARDYLSSNKEIKLSEYLDQYFLKKPNKSRHS